MDKSNNDFFVGYVGQIPQGSKKGIRLFVLLTITSVVLGAFVFSWVQLPFANSTFELTKESTISGIYLENPYPMLRILDSLGQQKSIMLLGFGKKGANSYIDHLKENNPDLTGSRLKISGNLIYYSDKSLLQITSQEKVMVVAQDNVPYLKNEASLGIKTLEGEIVDPKCYFGVMKPGFGKIHRSCAILCISGGIPPVFISNTSEHYIITNLKGQPMHRQLAFAIGRPSKITGEVINKGDNWFYIKINEENIQLLQRESTKYQ